MKLLHEAGRPIVGTLCCGAAALLAAFTLANKPWHGLVPVVFVFVIVLLARRYGALVGLLGSVTAALIFAYSIFPPLGSFRIADPAERSNLAWMLLGGVVIPFLLLPPGGHGEAEKEHRSGK